MRRNKKAASIEAGLYCLGAWLESDLPLYLDEPWRRVCAQSRAINTGWAADRAGDLPKLRMVGVFNREVEVGMVEDVEESRTNRELCSLPLGYAEALLHRKVLVEIAWAAELATSLVTEGGKRVSKVGRQQAGVVDFCCLSAAIETGRTDCACKKDKKNYNPAIGGEYMVVLKDGKQLSCSRSYRAKPQELIAEQGCRTSSFSRNYCWKISTLAVTSPCPVIAKNSAGETM